MPPQLVPPALPGNISEPRRLGGVYIPSQRSDFIVSRHLRRSKPSSPNASSGSSVVAVSGGGAAGNGCVGDVISPGTSVCGTGRSSIGNNDSPVRRSSTNRIPILVACTSAGTSPPSRRSVTSVGCAGTSKSQTSWCTVWKRHATSPVSAWSATTDADQ